MAERLNAPVSKTGSRFGVTWVRIPPVRFFPAPGFCPGAPVLSEPGVYRGDIRSVIWRSLNPLLLGVALVLGLAGVARGQGVEPEKQVDIPRLPEGTEPPRIDGDLGDAAWQLAVVVEDFRQAEPEADADPSQPTRMLLMYDRATLYIAFHCYDDPDAIIATQMERDADLDSDDRITFVVDPFFDRRNGFFFDVNPLGAKRDGLVEQGRRPLTDWDGIWYAKTSIVEDGWIVEIALPLQTISFSPDSTRWGFNAGRRIRRNNEEVRWTGVQFNESLLTMADAGAIEGLAELEPGLGLDFKPYGTIGYEREDGEDTIPLDGGFDLVYRLTPGLTAQLTVNTDFAETEADIRQTNLHAVPAVLPREARLLPAGRGHLQLRRDPALTAAVLLASDRSRSRRREGRHPRGA